MAHYSDALAYGRVFAELGCQVDTLDSSLTPPSLLNRLYNRLCAPPTFWSKALREKLLAKTAEFRPELIILFKPLDVDGDTVKKLQSQAKVFLRMDDNIFLPSAASVQLWSLIPEVDCIFTPKTFNIGELLKKGARRVELMLQCVDTYLHHPVEVSPQEQIEFGADIMFFGTYEPERADYLERLCGDGYDLKVYGLGWQSMPRGSCLQRKGFLKEARWGSELNVVVSASKICLCFLRKVALDLQTRRTFDIAGIGGFMLHERTDEVKALFEEGREAEYFFDYDEMRAKIDRYLNDDQARQAIAQAGYQRIMRDGHTFKTRAQQFLAVFQQD